MTDTEITPRLSYGLSNEVFQWTSIAALTAAADKARFIVTRACRIVDIICDSETAGSGGVSDIIDVNVNGTTIYTTQDNRPTLLVGNTGMFTEAGEPEVTVLSPGDIITVDVDQVATTGSAKFTIAIVTVAR